jgi:L,D-transpeptidase catalytic domain
MSKQSRRWFLGSVLGGLGCAVAWPFPRVGRVGGVAPDILRRALAALDRCGDRIEHRDVMAIADFSLASRSPRFHLVDLEDGSVSSHWVAHGRGSDPDHTGWLERFSNEPHSNATSAGAYRTGEPYTGAHGRSIRLEGLDTSNSNAASRAVVVHAAWYVSAAITARWGMLGRSEGCFAVSHDSLNEVLARLGPGRLIYADKA